jgi:hypothetical protein
MTNRLRRSLVAAALVVTAAGGGLLGSGAAAAAPVETGSLTMTSDPGDYIGQGLTYGYSTAAGDSFNASSSSDGSFLTIAVNAANGDWWFLDFAAPIGEALAPGTYLGATRASFRAPGEPGLDVGGNGRGCNMLTGSFTVNAVQFGPAGYVQTFDATFEQHCEGADPAMRGHVTIANPPPPAALDLGISVATSGTASTLNGNATVFGTVTCTQPVPVSVSGAVTQVVKRTLLRGNFGTTVSCTPGAAVAWQATAVPGGTTPFQKGDAEVMATAYAVDPNYGETVTASTTAAVRLRKT